MDHMRIAASNVDLDSPSEELKAPQVSEEEDVVEARRKRYAATVLLPDTPFPMRANLLVNERGTRERWAAMDLYSLIREARRGEPIFSIHDGPPYPNGSIHLGHLLNKCLKDFLLKAKTMSGMDCPFVPGWDCHGLPIEYKVMLEGEKRGIDESDPLSIRQRCSEYSEKFVALHKAQFQHLLVFGDYDHAYTTTQHEFEAHALNALSKFQEEGLLYYGLKPVHWSIANCTALAEAELEYYDRIETAAYVKFPLTQKKEFLNRLKISVGADRIDSVDLVIWTTTPWTLPANLAIAVNSAQSYSVVRQEDRLLVMASSSAEKLIADGTIENGEIIFVCKGTDLVGLRYEPVYRVETSELRKPNAHTVLEADFIREDEGTGLVHIAPGHGEEDYRLGNRNNLVAYCPVKEDGRYDESVPEHLRGQMVFDASQMILSDLAECGRLLHTEEIVHSFPHDWRSKTPVISRATQQWFIGVDRKLKNQEGTLRTLAIDAIEDVAFHPATGKNRLIGMLRSRPDWCISRQRSWGLPIPAFFDSAGNPFMTAASIRAVAKRVAEEGSDVWYKESARELLRDYDSAADPECSLAPNLDDLEPGRDILDVWVESGCTWYDVIMHSRQESNFPVDLYIEGGDQHRGWFQSSLLVSVVTTGEAPYQAIVTHGFIVDRDGKKLSKSRGDTVEGLFKTYGSDILRWWASSASYEGDVRVDKEFFEEASQSYRKIRNTLRFLLAGIADFDSNDRDPEWFTDLSPYSLNAWVLNELNKLIVDVRSNYEALDFKAVHTAISTFCSDTLSSEYFPAIKDSLYCDAQSSDRRRAVQATLFEITESLVKLLAPILSHTAEEAYFVLNSLDSSNMEHSVHLERFPEPLCISATPEWERTCELRNLVQRALEAAKDDLGIANSLDAGLVVPSLGPHFDLNELAEFFGVSEVRLSDICDDPIVIDLRNRPRCERSWRRDATVKQRSDGGWLSDRDAEVVGVD